MERGLVFGILISTCVAVAAETPQTLVFNMGFANGSPQAEFQTRLTRNIFSRLGIDTEFVRVAAERALLNVEQGIDDGNLVRIAGLDERYPNMLRVEEAMVQYDFVAITRHADTDIGGWIDLAEHDVAIITGWKVVEDNVRHYRSLIKVRDGEALFDLLQAGRVHTAIYERLQALNLMEDLGCHAARIVAPPLTSRSMYMYLNRRHADLVPEVERVLREFKADGSYQALHQMVFGAPAS